MVAFRFDEATGTFLCTFTGRMDTVASGSATEAFNAEMERLRGRAETLRIVFDLAGVDFIASSFLRLSLIAAKGVAKGNFSIVGADQQILKVFKIAGLSSILNVS